MLFSVFALLRINYPLWFIENFIIKATATYKIGSIFMTIILVIIEFH